MLSYGDSKELEKLGYSQELKDGDWFYWLDAPDDPPFLYFSAHLKIVSDYVKVPTTDGMIEGLGDDYFLLKNGPTEFTKEGDKPLLVAMAITDEGTRHYCEGRTPDQALCELWKKVKK